MELRTIYMCIYLGTGIGDLTDIKLLIYLVSPLVPWAIYKMFAEKHTKWVYFCTIGMIAFHLSHLHTAIFGA